MGSEVSLVKRRGNRVFPFNSRYQLHSNLKSYVFPIVDLFVILQGQTQPLKCFQSNQGSHPTPGGCWSGAVHRLLMQATTVILIFLVVIFKI